MEHHVKPGAQPAGRIFNIQRFSVHDGPGIRDVVFTKGCPLRCLWCCNPESQNTWAEIGYIANKCIGVNECAYCLESCPTGAIKPQTDGSLVQIDRHLCDNCGKCAEVCPARAITLFGQLMSVEDVIKAIQHNDATWRTGGGITVSGGEMLMQADFVHQLLRECRKKGIDTAVETSGYGRWADLERVCRYCNLIFYDIKCMDANGHKKFPGVYNELILENLVQISKVFPDKQVIVRTPVIPEFNDAAEDITAIANFLTRIGNLKEYELMAYHAFGGPKYEQLGRQYRLGHLKSMSKEHIAQLDQMAKTILCP